MKKRFDISLREGYVNKGAGMLNQGMIPVNNGDILHRLILGKTKSGEVLKTEVIKVGIVSVSNAEPLSKPSDTSLNVKK